MPGKRSPEVEARRWERSKARMEEQGQLGKRSPEARARQWEVRKARMEERRQLGKRSPEGQTKQGMIDHATAPFVAWDGEGINIKSTSRSTHYYVFLANSDGVFITPDHPGRHGLRTRQILAALHESHLKNPGAIHVIYGGNYDFSQWLVDLAQPFLARLHVGELVWWGGYGIQVMMGKRIRISFPREPDSPPRTRGSSMTIYDVVSFFQCAFVTACESYLHNDVEGLEFMRGMKARRNRFTKDDLDEMRSYNDVELRNLVKLMERFRENVKTADLLPSRWDGPGAIAEQLLRREHVDRALSRYNPIPLPPEVARASRAAYAGGRFERLRIGIVHQKAIEYDINSAYPASLRHVPDLAHGRWVHVQGDPGDRAFALYHVRVRDMDSHTRPGALFCRSDNGCISYPSNVEGWYHAPEIATLRRYVDAMERLRGEWPSRYFSNPKTGEVKPGVPKVEFIEAWVYEPDDPAARPFGFIEPLYDERQRRKAVGDGSEKAIKLALNSMYGKLAQQLGWNYKNPERIPAFHELLYAGYTTAYTRAMVLDAALQKPDKVIAFETDALFVTEPLELDTSSGLEKWEEVNFDWLAYAQSGIYFGGRTGGKKVNKTRGVDKEAIDITSFERGMRGCDCKQCADQPPGSRNVMHGKDTRFINIGLALAGDFRKWNQWVATMKTMAISPSGKRTHADACYACNFEQTKTWVHELWHTTECQYPHRFAPVVPNALHPVIWEDWDGVTDINDERVKSILYRLEHTDRKESADSWGDYE